MKTIAHFEIWGLTLEALVASLRNVVGATAGWTTDELKNEAYSEMHGAQCFWILLPAAVVGTPIGVAFGGEVIGAKREIWLGDRPMIGRKLLAHGKGRMRVTNIIPSEISEITTAQYNEAMSVVWRRIRSLTKGSGLKMRFKSGDWGLQDVIPGEIARTMFTRWLQGYPKTFHPSDLERLDFFIVALFRTKTKCTGSA